MKIIQKLLFLSIFYWLTITLFQVHIYSEFLVQEDEENIKNKIPKIIVTDIQAEPVPDINGAIRITWNFPDDTEDDFIVGRSKEPMNSIENALIAESIAVVNSKAKSTVIDSNLPPGEYYYSIFSKKKIMDREIEFYPNENYTTSPAIIEKKIQTQYIPTTKKQILPKQVTLIHSRVLKKRWVLITWRKYESKNLIYTIYRGNSQLDTPEKLKSAKKVIQITNNKEGFVDKSISKSGTYFYAVTTKDFEGNEDLRLIPDQSYTTSGVYISIRKRRNVSNIEAKMSDHNSIRISWNTAGSSVAEYLIYKHNSPISNAGILASATFVDRVQSETSYYIDKFPGFGNRYYAVLIKLADGTLDTILLKNINYTTEPIIVAKPIQIKSISTETEDNRVIIRWMLQGSAGNRNYKIVRNESQIKSIDDVENSFTVDYVDIIDQNKIYDNPPSGQYYYAITPQYLKRNKEYKLFNNVNTTIKPIIIERAETKPKKIIKKTKKKITKIIKNEEKIKVEKSSLKYPINKILQDFFFAQKYNIAIKELKNIINNSNNKHEVAKAKLFIGRSWLEKKYYKIALKYFLLPDVMVYFPVESKCWYENALLKIE
ncbi:MAG: hypothetical protein SVR08_14030 [Spirochaetota bacterium]|nr:hypothetical protein [Spirochaetota bacterium]